jgi:hypothetical protein
VALCRALPVPSDRTFINSGYPERVGSLPRASEGGAVELCSQQTFLFGYVYALDLPHAFNGYYTDHGVVEVLAEVLVTEVVHRATYGPGQLDLVARLKC